MSLRTLLFGRRIDGETLKNLAKALGQNDGLYSRAYDGWTLENVWGRAVTKPDVSGIDVELDAYRREVHIVFSDDIPAKIVDKEYRTSHWAHLRGVIPYQPNPELDLSQHQTKTAKD